MSPSLKSLALRAGMVFGVLVFLKHPFILGLGSVLQSAAGVIGLGAYPMQGEFLLLLLLSIIGGFVWRAVDANRLDNDTLWQLFLVEMRYVLAAAMLLSGLAKVLHV